MALQGRTKVNLEMFQSLSIHSLTLSLSFSLSLSLSPLYLSHSVPIVLDEFVFSLFISYLEKI